MKRTSVTIAMVLLVAAGCVEIGEPEIEEEQAAVTDLPWTWYDGRTALFTGSPRPVAAVISPYFNGRSYDYRYFEVWGVDVNRRDLIWHVVGAYTSKPQLTAQVQEELGYTDPIGSLWSGPIIGDLTTGVGPSPPRPGGTHTAVVSLAVTMYNANQTFLAR